MFLTSVSLSLSFELLLSAHFKPAKSLQDRGVLWKTLMSWDGNSFSSVCLVKSIVGWGIGVDNPEGIRAVCLLSLSPAFFSTRLQLFESPPASCQLDSLRKHLHTPPASHWGNRCMVEKFEQYGKADRWRICIQAVSPGSDKAVKWRLCPGFVRVTIILIRWAVFEKAFSLSFRMKATLMNSKVMKDLDT